MRHLLLRASLAPPLRRMVSRRGRRRFLSPLFVTPRFRRQFLRLVHGLAIRKEKVFPRLRPSLVLLRLLFSEDGNEEEAECMGRCSFSRFSCTDSNLLRNKCLKKSLYLLFHLKKILCTLLHHLFQETRQRPEKKEKL